MTELGELVMRSGHSVIEARRKVRGLAAAIGFDDVVSTRLATAASEIGRGLLDGASRRSIGVSLDDAGGRTRLAFEFEAFGDGAHRARLESFFDALQVVADDGPDRLLAVKELRSKGALLDAPLLARLREQLRQRSRADLMRDVQEKNRELEEHQAQLEETVERRTEALRKAQSQAEDANRAKSEFLSNMSHELRTPLNGVLGYSQILQRDSGLSSQQRSSLDAIENCGRHLLTLINDVLDLSKIEAGKLELERQPCDLPRLVQSVYDITRPRAEKHGLAFEVDLSPTAPRGILTDGTKLKQVLVNLLGNAVKFTSEGTVTLRLAEVDGGRIAFHVQDTGIGMTEQECAEVFDPFKQAEGGKVSGGTGLGLPISKKIVEALGGVLTLTSERGKGTCFTATLPAEEVDDATLDTADDTVLTDSADLQLAAGHEATILVVDDLAINRDILVNLLETAGFATLQAENGREAVDLVKQGGVSMVLMDIRMPVMNGMDATREIRATPEIAKTPVLAVSASVFPKLGERTAEAGFDDFIGKPFRAGDVFRKLETYLGVTYVRAGAEVEPADDTEGAAEAEETTPAADGLTAEQAGALATRLREACEMGDVDTLAAVAAELGGDVGQELEGLIFEFDFDGIGRLAGRLESGGADA